MNESLQYIRQAIITRLTNSVTFNGSYVPIYNRLPSSSEEPYVKVYSLAHREIDQNATSFTSLCETRIEVFTAFDADDGGEYQSNSITDQIINLIRTRSAGYYDLSSHNFSVYTCEIESIKYSEKEENDKTYFKSLITISNRIQKI
tara:strand:+ start:5928 stop:6365 length:438 start_codon:yes stop_codon:yes gene_type:complete